MTKRILIVDDENYIRLLLRRTLEELEFSGVEIHLAEDGVTGLAAARALKPDLIFLDLMMPRLTGEEVCAAIVRQLHRRAFSSKEGKTEGSAEWLSRLFFVVGHVAVKLLVHAEGILLLIFVRFNVLTIRWPTAVTAVTTVATVIVWRLPGEAIRCTLRL